MFARALLTRKIVTVTATAARSTAGSARTLPLYNPLLTPRFFRTSAKMGVHNVMNKNSFAEALAEKGHLMVLDCFATWCGPCKVIAPQVVKFSDQYPDVRFYKVDVDEVPDVAQDLGIRAMPTFVLFRDGEKVDEVVGANPKALEAAIVKHK